MYGVISSLSASIPCNTVLGSQSAFLWCRHYRWPQTGPWSVRRSASRCPSRDLCLFLTQGTGRGFFSFFPPNFSFHLILFSFSSFLFLFLPSLLRQLVSFFEPASLFLFEGVIILLRVSPCPEAPYFFLAFSSALLLVVGLQPFIYHFLLNPIDFSLIFFYYPCTFTPTRRDPISRSALFADFSRPRGCDPIL